ncbi:MAG: A/G-specific adenine glycosylase [Bacteroidetes bacterium]|jgi:A/G-specific adenine glycosylase|nr:A/G-specific adenine glycosylase [Bacteroidota bacterium]
MRKGKKEVFFTAELMHWNQHQNFREMPWKAEKDPYKIWLSEIILQQTRVEQGWNYYNAFIEAYPTILHLAAATDKEVYKLWEGLGYYSRCKNLLFTARYIATNYKGIFPSAYDAILQLKGVGPYTAAAIASFAFNIPKAVVDGNVMRVLSRYFGNKTAIDSTEGKKVFTAQAETLLDTSSPGKYNQAIMDFGATICKPKSPLCEQCPISARCTAYHENAVADYPVKEKKLLKKNRWLYYIIAEHDDAVTVRMRNQKDIWQNLYEFILIENSSRLTPDAFIASSSFKKIVGKQCRVIDISPEYKQLLTHQVIHGFFVHIKTKNAIVPEGYHIEKLKIIASLPFPKFINNYLQKTMLLKP